MEKKQKTLSLLLALALGAGSNALAEPVPTLDVRPVLTQVPLPAATTEPTERPILTQAPVQPSEPTTAPDWCPPATVTPPPVYMPESTAVPKPTIAATPVPTPAPTAEQTPEATKKPAVATPAPSTDDDYTTGYVGMQEKNAFLLLNQDRAANGLAPLTLDPVLCSIARAKSQDMKDNRYFAHTSPTWGSASQMLKSFGYSFNTVGENIAHHATVEKSQAAFMSSQGHRKNILSTSWRKVGIGVVTDNQGFVYVTQLFVR